MILGIGSDVVSIVRIEEAENQFKEKFLQRIFTKNEINSGLKKSLPKNFFAKRFAAKEAFSKAIGLGIGRGINFADIEIVNDDFGKPEIKILNDKKICYAVGVNMDTFIGELDNCSRDYFIIIHEKDLFYGIQGFHESEEYRNICERTLTEKEIQEFKANLGKYVLTMQNDSGRIYELVS